MSEGSWKDRVADAHDAPSGPMIRKAPQAFEFGGFSLDHGLQPTILNRRIGVLDYALLHFWVWFRIVRTARAHPPEA